MRAIAVLAVVLFHAGVPGVAGGYLGVDVFFVISGYLITRIVVRDAAAGRFSFTSFYEHRVRRIAPALIVMLAACLGLSLMLLPADMRRFDDSLVATVAFLANVFFIKSAGYFATSPETWPLQHMWSLSAEEQLYLILPICLIGAARLGRHGKIIVIPALMLGVLTLQAGFVRRWPESGYYLPFMRGAEFLVGSALATGLLPPLRGPIAQEVAAWFGLGLLAFVFHRAAGSGPASYGAGLAASLGTALVLHGTDGQDGLVRRGLSTRPAVLIGRASYSLYLWHWPFIVFGAYYVFDSGALPLAKAACAAASVPVAFLSWRYIERPFRGPGALLSRRQAFLAAGAAACILACAGVAGHAMHGAPWRFDGTVRRIIGQPQGMLSPCTNQSLSSISQHQYCRVGSPSAVPSFVLWGDSHADMYYNGIDEMALRQGVSGYIFSQVSCPFYEFATGPARTDAICVARNALIRNVIAGMRPKAVVFAERWSTATSASAMNTAAADDWLAAMQGGLDRTTAFAQQAGARVFIVADAPEPAGVVPDELAKAHILGYDLQNGPPAALHLEPSMARYDAMETAPRHIFGILSRRRQVTFIEPQALFCDRQSCRIAVGATPLYRDNHHLSADGARFASPAFAPLMQWLTSK